MICVKDNVVHKHQGSPVVLPDKFRDYPIVEPGCTFAKCDCDLVLYCIEDCFKLCPYFRGDRFEGDRRRSTGDMYYDILKGINRNWQLTRTTLLKIKCNDNVSATCLKIATIPYTNIVLLPELFELRTIPMEQELQYPQCIMAAYRRYDVYNLRNHMFGMSNNEVASYLKENVWLQVRKREGQVLVQGVPWEHVSEDPVVRYLRRESAFNISFGGSPTGPNAVFSLDGIYKYGKIDKIFQKYNHPTNKLFEAAKPYMHLLPKVFSQMPWLLGSEHRINTLDFVWSKEMLWDHIPPLLTSHGADPSPRIVVPGAYTTIYSGKGKKLENIPGSIEKIWDFGNKCGEGLHPNHPSSTYKCTDKNESFVVSPMEDESEEERLRYEAEKLKNGEKLRNYVIATTTNYQMASIINKAPNLFERGISIKIGFKWKRGGAQSLGDQLHWKKSFSLNWYNKPDSKGDVYYGPLLPKIEVVDSDYSGCDFTMPARTLVYFQQSRRMYYNTDAMADFLKRVFNGFSRANTSVFTVKEEHFIYTVWAWVEGNMASGHFDTGSATSWGMMFHWCWFYCIQQERYPEKKAIIVKTIQKRTTLKVSYGDDNIIKYPFKHRSYLGIEEYKWFITNCIGMILRDIHVCWDVITFPDHATGGIVKAGPVFLQRYLIQNPHYESDKTQSTLVPYRPYKRTIAKLAHGSGDRLTAEDYALSCVGMAYDTYGTNVKAYNFVRQVFNSIMVNENVNWEDIVRKILTGELKEKNLTKMLRKSEITKKEVLNGFPTLEKLVSEHVYDAGYVDFTNYDDFQY